MALVVNMVAGVVTVVVVVGVVVSVVLVVEEIVLAVVVVAGQFSLQFPFVLQPQAHKFAPHFV